MGLVREVLEGAVRDHVHALAAAEQVRPVARVHDHRVHPLGEPHVHRLAPDHVVHREDSRPRGGQQVRVDPLDRKPLEVAHVRVARTAAVAEHVRHVLRGLQQAAPARRAPAPALVASR